MPDKIKYLVSQVIQYLNLQEHPLYWVASRILKAIERLPEDDRIFIAKMAETLAEKPRRKNGAA